MITCKKETVLPIDQRVLDYVATSSAFHLNFDSDYLRSLPSFHGGIPLAPFFTTPNREIRQVAWFVSFLDDNSKLPKPFESGFYFRNKDARISDRSIPGIMDDDVSPYLDGKKIYPFGALVTDEQVPLTLRLYTLDSYPGDSLCFDVTTSPHSVVICNGRLATEEVVRWDNGETDEIDYDVFLQYIAGSFSDFAKMLRMEP